ncbi:hypothetical protein [Laspinema olomoucense]|uniref:Uncharacterized protein n=1 Tax=Laspinema olomoucense D3b TaxID=2953688 RepID=A0ABT2N528_9CYAN|nr:MULTISPECIES: hypothetical protein [unclassified Laspinema]MCT7970519.1 hypothetical protein [Laspinema sp. D3d]MCT7976979.1 hypothetical protein [Laspinema sp. D3b]MCT7991645.1 hypothetical protein [Laspinema sp. D3a]MCT7993978.1 hypothetical protein [Laspinema sp. D3c]
MKVGSSLAQYCYWARLLSKVSFLEEVTGDFPLVERSLSLGFTMDVLPHLYDLSVGSIRADTVFHGVIYSMRSRVNLTVHSHDGGLFLAPILVWLIRPVC